MANLITVPTFTFNQGDPIREMDELPISVDFYDGCIVLRQDGEFTDQEEIKIHPKHFNKLFNEIKKHLPEAQGIITKRI